MSARAFLAFSGLGEGGRRGQVPSVHFSSLIAFPGFLAMDWILVWHFGIAQM